MVYVCHEHLCSSYRYNYHYVSIQRSNISLQDLELYVCRTSLIKSLLTRPDIYIGMELSVVPVFQSEIAPTQIRGFMVGTYQLTIVVSANIL